MKFWENPKYRESYPEYLTKQEKADIKSALLQRLTNGKTSFDQFLIDIKNLADYPEKEVN
ncbi:hypothetical protein EC523_09305 [Avibacterium paragallinarum]|uniref:Uncharacterized protein n=1 Tax=Avibacterium paragallinarum TaxID=728 RepID=A0A377I868_AVIPA|nr:hypothetical protein [Avibacterium paragallinarum]POY46446.1 hypothetical protein C3364_07410 [Avibacterium paragallinarum]RZN75286.1 hypothetical protein EC523_09305 [Avibacterium paragallinarum]STO71383.1 Uncharacterised protein [Avibacterium paragallinarum]